jgi:hypothetical protein
MAELKIDVTPLRKRKLFIATPAYGGQQMANFTHSLFGLQQLLLRLGIECSINCVGNESLISRARNRLVWMFLQTSCTDLMFIDADIQFNPDDVVYLMHFASEPATKVIGGAYPLKMINWAQIKQAVLRNPDIDPAELPKVGAVFASHTTEATGNLPDYAVIPAHDLATGFMLIRRDAFITMAPHCKTYVPSQMEGLGITRVREFFPVGVEGDEYLSEDYYFCKKWREIGGKLWLASWVRLNHIGQYTFQGDFRYTSRLTAADRT